MGLMDNARRIAGKMKLGSHHAIERFGVIFAALSGAFVLLVVSTAVSSWSNSQADLSAAAVYGDSFTTSLTQQSGDIAGVYVSEDHQRAMVLMELTGGSSDNQVWSSNAENYQAFVDGVTPAGRPQSLATNITGSIVSFGSTGYLGVLMDSDEPFQQQIMALTMRNNAELVAGEDPDPELSGTSFADHDQWRLFVNPGATGAVEISSLAGPGLDVADVYAEIVLAQEEQEIRAELDESLVQMRADLARIREYESDLETVRADGLSIVPPTVPDSVSGDTIVGEPADVFEGEVIEESTLALDSEWVDPEGWNIDWRSGSIASGYLDSLVPEGESYYSYLENKSNGIASGDSDDAPPEDEIGTPVRDEDKFRVSDIEWELSDGTDLTEQSQNQALTPLVNLMNSLSQAYQDYYTNKQTYQVDQHRSLLELELQLSAVDSSYTINSEDTAFEAN